ncbi:MAG: hypothetical protein KC684_02080 [Candidatus Omnitrophica bacterium]|nr:hypothetical protein [Candidatus Omnitrophota bacterium]
MKALSTIKYGLIVIILGTAGLVSYNFYHKIVKENEVLKQVVERLEADSRVAEVLVTGVRYDEEKNKTFTTIKFVEYDRNNQPLKPKYFTFSGNIIQFQSLVIRFDDINIRNAKQLKDKSAFLFWKVFMLDGQNTQEFEINAVNSIPSGYKVEGMNHPYEKELWEKFWTYAMDPEQAKKGGIKNAQVEAPGVMFTPGILYTVHIEHDGGLRIDARPLPAILKGERIPE